jgi:hypothetical protein
MWKGHNNQRAQSVKKNCSTIEYLLIRVVKTVLIVFCFMGLYIRHKMYRWIVSDGEGCFDSCRRLGDVD